MTRQAIAALSLTFTAWAQAQPAAWQETASLGVPRHHHTATLLPDGGVLVAGGQDLSGALASTERYDFVAGRWRNSGVFPDGTRTHHSATALTDGTVLLTGGTSDSGGDALLRSSLLYDTQSGAFTATASMAVARRYHTATLLADGRVLVAGGQAEGHAALNRAEIYDPATRAWSPTSGQMLLPGRYHHTATRLPGGRVLLLGGTDAAGAPIGSAIAWHPPGTHPNQPQDLWIALTPMPQARTRHSATLLPDGRIYVAGGLDADGQAAGTAWLFDPGANTWTETAPLATGRAGHSATLLPDGRVLLTGGRGRTGLPLLNAEYFRPDNHTSTGAPPLGIARAEHTATLLPGGQVLVTGGCYVGQACTSIAATTARLNIPALTTRNTFFLKSSDARLATALPDGSVLVAGGSRGVGGGTSGHQPSARFDPATLRWHPTGPAAFDIGRHAHSQTLLADGRVLLAGGYDAGSQASDRAEIYTPSADILQPAATDWAAAAPMLLPRGEHTATLLPGGQVLVAGGSARANGESVAHSELYTPASNTWHAAAALRQARVRHSATRMADGRVLVAGGASGNRLLASVEIYNPASGAWTAAAPMEYARSGHRAALLKDGRVIVLGGSGENLAPPEIYDPATGAWESIVAHGEGRSGQTVTVLPDGRVLVTGGYNGVQALARIDILDPVSMSWTSAGTMPQARNRHAATPLPDGSVVVVSGYLPTVGDDELPLVIDAARPLPSHRTRPAITGLPALLDPGRPLTLTGTGLMEDSEASGGATTHSGTNVPLVHMEKLDGGPASWLTASQASAHRYTSRPLPPDLPAGVYNLRIYTNGVASATRTFTLLGAGAPPDTPVGVAAAPGNWQVTIQWQPSASGPAPTSYTVIAEPGGSTCTVQAPVVLCTVQGLTNGETYRFTVTAATAAGISAPSASVSSTPSAEHPEPPGAPRQVVATPGDGQVTVRWLPPVIAPGGQAPTSYRVVASPGGASCSVPAPATSCIVRELANGTAYTFVATAISAEAEVSAAPTGPVTPMAGQPGPGQIAAVPALDAYALALLALSAAGLGARRLNRRRAVSKRGVR